MTGVLIFLACVPSIILLFFILKMDKYNKEPIRLLIGLFLLGIIAVIPAIIVEKVLININFFNGFLGLLIEAFLIIALTEEFFKRLAVKVKAFNSPAYDERLDGIVYCVVASLGFATVENIMYVLSYSDAQPYIWLTRALLSVPAHMLFGVTMGYYLSMSKFINNPTLKKKYYSYSLWIPVLFHGLYDTFALSGNIVLIIMILPLMIYMWIFNLKRIKVYRRESQIQNGM